MQVSTQGAKPDVSQPHYQWFSSGVWLQRSIRLTDRLRGSPSGAREYGPSQQQRRVTTGTNGAPGIRSCDRRQGAREECPFRVSCDQHQIFSHKPENFTTTKSTRTSKIHMRKPLTIRENYHIMLQPFYPRSPLLCCAQRQSVRICFSLFVKCWKLCLYVNRAKFYFNIFIMI